MSQISPTKLRIQSEALRLFVERGVGETSVRDLAQAAGVAEGTLYRHYVSKDALVADLFVSNYTAFAGRLDQVIRRHARFADRLDAVVAEVCDFYDAEPTLFRFLLLVQHQALPHVPEGPRNPVSVLQAMVDQGIASGEIGVADPVLASSIILGLLLQPATAIVYGRLAPPMARLAPDIAGACRRALSSDGPH